MASIAPGSLSGQIRGFTALTSARLDMDGAISLLLKSVKTASSNWRKKGRQPTKRAKMPARLPH